MEEYMTEAYAMKALQALATLVVGWMFAGWTQRITAGWMRRAKMDEAVLRFLASMARYTVLCAVVLAALGTLGFNTGSLLAIFGAAGLAVGLALQGSLSHFASGVLLLHFRPFTIGHKVTIAGITGDVEEIGLFGTTLSTLENARITIPNGTVTGNPITNITGQGSVRGSVNIGVAYGEDIDQALDVLAKAAAGSPLTLDDPAPATAFVSFGASSLDIQIHCWCKPADFLDMMHDVRIRAYKALNEAGIDIPFNTVTVLKGDSEDGAAA